MADESKKKAYYDSLVRAGVVQPETSFEAFNLKIRDSKYAKIVYSGLKTASELNIVKGVPNEQEFNSVLQVGQFPTQPELSEDVPEVKEIKEMGVPASKQTAIPPVSNIPNQPQPTATETQIAPIDQQAGQVQGGMPQGKGLSAGQFQITDTRIEPQEQSVVASLPEMEPIQQTVTAPTGQAVQTGDVPQDGMGYFDYLGNALQRGYNRGEIADYITATGKTPTGEEFSKIAELTAQNDKLATSQAMQDFANNPDLESTLKSLPEIALESLSSLYRHGLARMGAGAIAGGVAGSVIPGAGTLAGAGTGALSGMTVAGLGLEVSGTIMDGLRELNIDTKDANAIKTAFSNPAVMDFLKQKAYARGIPIAALDAVSMGVAGKILGKPVASAVGRGLQVLGEAGIQGGLGATGELLAQINSGENIKGYEILAEGLAEIPGSIPEVGIAVLSKNKGAGKDTKVESARLAIGNPDMPIEAINESIDVGVGTGEINATQATELKQEVTKAREIDAKIPAEIKDTELRVTAIGLIEERDNLNAQLETVDEAFKPAIQEKIKGINEQLANMAKPEVTTEQQITPAPATTEVATEAVAETPTGTTAEAEVKLAELPTKTIEAEVVSETPVAGAEAMTTETILDKETDLKGNEKDEFMFPVTYTESKRVGDEVEFVNSQGEQMTGNYRGTNNKGEAIIDSPTSKDGKKFNTTFVVPEDKVTFPQYVDTGIGKGDPDAIQYAIENNLFTDAIAQGRMSANDAKTIIESAGLKVPVAIEQLLTPTQDEDKTGLILYHGSPHSFKEFDISKLGSGEGVQAFGHGLYFTNEVDIAKGYANKLGSKKNFWEALKNGNEISLTKEDFDFIKNEIEALGFDGYSAEQSNIGDIRVDGKNEYAPDVLEALAVAFGKNAKYELENFDLTEEQVNRLIEIKRKISDPQLYKIAAHEGKSPSEYDYIDWREKLTDSQRKKIGGEFADNVTGEEVYKSLSQKLGSDQKASEFLLSKGIDGITYKSNKGTGGKTGKGRNYVIFDTDAIRIDEINQQKQQTPTQDAVQIEKTSSVPVQSGTTSSQEVAKGEPKAEPQSTADKGQAQATATQEEVGGLPKEIADLYQRRGQLEFTKNALEKQMGNKPLVGKSKKEYDNVVSELASVESQIKEYEDSKIPQQKVSEESKTEPLKTTATEPATTENDYANYLLDLIEQKQKELGWKDSAELRAGLAKQFNETLSDRGLNRAISDLESTYVQYLPEGVRAGAYQTLKKNFEKQQATAQTTPTAETTTFTEATLTPINATDVETITKIENATEKGRELALNKPTNKHLKRAFEAFQDLSDRARKAGIYDGKTLKIGGQEIEVDTPAKFKAFLAQSQANFDAINEAVDKSEIDVLKAERDTLIQEFIKGMGKATMNLNPQQVSILAQLAWKNLQIVAKQSKLSSGALASLIKRKVDEAVAELNQMLTQSGQNTINPDKEDITNVINNVRKLAQGIATASTSTAGQIGTAGQPSATQSPIYTKEQEELARKMETKMDEGKPFVARSEPFWTAVKRKTAELRQKLDSPRELLNFAEKMIGTTPGSSYNRTRELPLGRAMEQLRGKARSLALPYMERISNILKPIESNLPDFEKYLIYRRIIDRAVQDKLNQDAYNQGLLKKKPTRRTTGGMTETNADILLNDLRNRVGADLFDKFTQAGDELQQVFDDNLKDLVNAGVLTQERYDAIKAQNEFYVPFDVVQRDFRGNVITGTEYDRTNAQGQSVVKKIKGIDTPKNTAEANDTVDVFYKMMQNGDIDVDSYYYLATESITDARNQGNITQQEYEELMDSLSEPGLELHSPLNKTLNIINASQYQVARQGYMKDIDMLVDADTNNDYFVRLENKDKLPSGMSVITYYKDGVQQRVAVDEKLKQAIDTMTSPELNAFEKFLKSGSFLFKIAATSASISFLPVNFVIDLTRSLTSKAGLGSGATVTERAASVVQIPVIYSEALVNAIIGNLLNTKLGNALKLKSITPNFMYNQYEDWKKSPSYSEGSYLGHLVDRLKSGRTKSEIEDAKFLETVQRRTNTILGNPKTAKAIANAVLGTKQKTRMTVDGVMDIVNLISKMLENSHKIYGYTKLSGTETGVRKGIDRYIGGYIDKLHGRKKLTQAELENALDEVTDEVLNNIGSPNFEQIPPNMRAASIIVPFLGAAVKGNMSDVSRVLNSVNAGASKKERLDALAFTARNGAVFLIPAFITGLTMALKDDDDESKKMYDDMDENSKWSNSIIPVERNVDGEEGQFDFITIPIRGVPVIFNSIGRASGQALGMSMKERLTKEELKKISKDVLLSSFSSMMAFNLADKTYLSDIDPETGKRKERRKEEELLNRSMSFASGLNPVIKYLPERWANKNFFGKYSIEPENIRGKRLRNAILNEVIDPATGKPISPSLLKNKFTPDLAVTLSKYFERNGIRMNPMIIDHFFDTFLAGAPEKFDVGASELMKRRFLWKERKLAYGEKPKTN